MPRRAKGEGSIKRRTDGAYEARLPYVDEFGRSRYKYFRGATPKEASDRMQQYRRDVARGAPQDPSKQTLEEYMAEWLKADAARHLRPHSIATYEAYSRLHIVPYLGHLAISDITPSHVQRMIDKLERAGKLAPATVAKARAVLQSALGDAVRRGLIHQNPARLARNPSARRHALTYWRPDQARTFLAAVQGHPMEAFYVLSLTLGWRLGEALGLRWSDVDMERGTLTIAQALERSSSAHNPVFTDCKTTGSRRTVRLSQTALTSLRKHRAAQNALRLYKGKEWRNRHDLVFVTANATPLNQNDVRRQFHTLTEKARSKQEEPDLPTIRVHDMRHTAATAMILAGVNIKVVSETLGHQSIRITLDIYGHLLDDQKQQVADAMDILLGGL